MTQTIISSRDAYSKMLRDSFEKNFPKPRSGDFINVGFWETCDAIFDQVIGSPRPNAGEWIDSFERLPKAIRDAFSEYMDGLVQREYLTTEMSDCWRAIKEMT